MFDLFKKEKEFIKQVKVNINDIKSILDEVHSSLFSGDKLEEEKIKEIKENLHIAKVKKESCPSSKNIQNWGSPLMRSLLYESFWVGLVLLLALTLGLTNFSIAIILAIGVYKELKEQKNEKTSFIIKKEEKSLKDLYKEIDRRIKYYKNIIAIKEAKLKEIDTPEDKAYPLIIANRYLEMLLDNEITLLDIPIDIQNVMLVMLQNELGLTGTLMEILEIVINKNSEKGVVKARKVTIHN